MVRVSKYKGALLRDTDWNSLIDDYVSQSETGYSQKIPLPQEVSYIILKEGNTIYAINGKTGQADYSGTNATSIIQSAIDAIEKGNIFFKKGTFEVTGIDLTGKNYVNLIGEGKDVSILKLKDGSDSHLIEKNDSSMVEAPFVIRDLTLDGNAQGQTSGSLIDTIYMQYIKYTKIINCIIKANRRHGIRFLYNYYCEIKGCILLQDIYGESLLLYPKMANGSVLSNNILIGSKQTGCDGIILYRDRPVCVNNYIESFDNGIHLEICNNGIISNNFIYDCNTGIYVTRSIYNNIIGNHIDECTKGMFFEGLLPERNLIVGNYFYNLTEGIRLHDSSNDNNIINNKFHTVTTPIIDNSTGNNPRKYNIGYITENSGTINIASGETITTNLDESPSWISLEAIGSIPVSISHELSGNDIIVYHNQTGSINIRWGCGV
jgi:parallel beta-helix repeat protein